MEVKNDKYLKIYSNNINMNIINNDIVILDNFLNDEELLLLNKLIIDKNYKYGHSSGYRELVISKFFASYNTEPFFWIILKEKIEKSFNYKYKVNRHYMHIQTFGQDGGFHIDDTGENKQTFCLYITNEHTENIDNIGGDFLIKHPNKNYTISINTNNNRGVLFPSYYVHKGMAYNIYSNNIRLCITWKLEII